MAELSDMTIGSFGSGFSGLESGVNVLRMGLQIVLELRESGIR